MPTKSALRKNIKRAASSFGLELMTPRGRQDLERGNRNVIDEYLRLLAKTRSVTLSEDADRTVLLSRLVGTGVAEGSHLVASLAAVKDLPGDLCECGVGSGATSALLANEVRGSGRTLWLYDTFAGLPAPTAEDELIDDIDHLGSMQAYTGRMSHPEAEMRARMKEIGIDSGSFRVVRGLFDATVTDDRLPDRICFAYIDFDFYAPIKTALEKLSPRLSPGGIIVVDDYGFFSKGAQTAVDEFVAANPNLFELEVPDYCADHFAILHRTRN
jgi:O-methyltransferase